MFILYIKIYIHVYCVFVLNYFTKLWEEATALVKIADLKPNLCKRHGAVELDTVA